ncbi:hypothetical protein [Pedobacter sp. MR2016-24]|uniref:hypothetical protein n=1 Tax=Pedobacter sp. MR2016-24 TaxID=2994466 RepID=UPI002246E12B|nr:hypothetical protein [Pedobacter sp. MR2016-24]MCX2483698.1 hypothetical protein [Pedobacter sp. MR2016-24]
MRYVIKRDEDKTARLASEATLEDLNRIVGTRNLALISDAVYRDTYNTPDGRRSHVEDQLAIAYQYKCAYCERLTKADIEHYRPKKGIAEDVGHLGYYWLCYEWSNLIPSCITCNREGAKHNQFPILGPRVPAPSFSPDGRLDLALCKAHTSPLLDEMPYLLHPEIDDPEFFFAFVLDPNGEGIRIVGIDEHDRGQRTIEICLLNRLELRLDRVERVISDFKDGVHGLLLELQANQINQTQFRAQLLQCIHLLHMLTLREEKTHTYLRKYIVRTAENFRNIVIPYIDTQATDIVLEAFLLYQERGVLG